MTDDGRESFASQLAALRSRAGLSLAELGAAAHVARGYVHLIEHGQRWPSRSVAAALDSSLSAEGTLLAVWEATDITVQANRTAVAALRPSAATTGDAEAVLVSAADESVRFLAWAETSNIGDLTLEQMHSDLRWTARNYLKVPTLPLFARVRTIRDRAFGLLAGRQRPDQSRDLYMAAGWALTLLAWMSTDLGRPDAADAHARAAWVCADNAGHHGLRAWVRASQHTAAFWENRFLDAARYAEDGLRYATTGSAEAFLASAQALDLAKVGHVDNARTALGRARHATEVVEQTCDELAGPFTCSVDRAGGFWSDVYLALGQPTDALAEADSAVAVFEQVPIEWRNPGSERMARIEQVRAHLVLSQLDGAYEALAPVLDTSPEYRVRPLMQRLGEVHTQVVTCEQRDEPLLCTMREAITVFREQAAVAELTS
ncbi:MAG: helix-turn-helix domain-containing protein [Pseudonocardiaceae bacterium]